MKEMILLSKEELIKELWAADPQINRKLRNSSHVEEARYLIFDYLNRLERDLYNMKSDTYFKHLNSIEKRNAKECIRVLANTFRTENEYLTQSSPLQLLYDLAKRQEGSMDAVSKGFLCEYVALFGGIAGKAGKLTKGKELSLAHMDGRDAAIVRSNQLDKYVSTFRRYSKRYKSGFDRTIRKQRKALKQDILKYFGATEDDWEDYQWHLKHVIKDLKTLSSLVTLEPDEVEGMTLAAENNIPAEITPYYLSLFNKDGRVDHDRAIRAQVIPGPRYSLGVIKSRKSGADLDFMGERSTSPIDGITRRYPEIVILKPFNACPQICVYCQRNWEIKRIDEGVQLSRKKVDEAVAWIRDHDAISEVLITGGDPLTLRNDYLDRLIGEVAKIRHVQRIRVASRTLVTLPCRINDGFVDILKKYHEWGKREVAVITHFEHPSEMTPESLAAIKKIKEVGINIYNQQVFTYYNSRKFETCRLRQVLKKCGVEPYYSFSTKGKEETIDFRVPVARIEQEKREEARLLAGLVRTDEPVFNLPKLGKSNLNAWQDHEVIMIKPDGRRIYRFYTWESSLVTVRDYHYSDVPIYDYLTRLNQEGEKVKDYSSIWYYF